MKKALTALIVAFCVLLSLCVGASADESAEVYPYTFAFEEFWYEDAVALEDTLPCKAALLMEADSGRVLFAQNETAKLPIASVTKIMSTLLVMEAIDSGKIRLTDMVTVGEEAAHMGGSQVYLEVGEQMPVSDMLKALVVVSANDATVAMAEHLAGSQSSFVSQMNARAAELGMSETHFANCHGLNEEGHYSCARDVAIMTRELLKHPLIGIHSDMDGYNQERRVRTGKHKQADPLLQRRERHENGFYGYCEILSVGYGKAGRNAAYCGDNRRGYERDTLCVGKKAFGFRFCQLCRENTRTY